MPENKTLDDAEHVERWRGYFRIRRDKETGLFVAGAVTRCTFHQHLGRSVPIWDPVAFGVSIQDLLQQCRNLGLTQLHGITREVSDIICYWFDNGKRATDYVGAMWYDPEEARPRTKLGFAPPGEWE